ncbi:hypothetical protein GX51_07224 [Blastomyces parvus]|uniref:Uncharacterized protein n=1 Tax=Blastomyces parvus TaxID=2060905 RepID=A0A2B7WMD2_9EURO|nr:hypothetical protein GX51_07224 [Blastomyces parvus]
MTAFKPRSIQGRLLGHNIYLQESKLIPSELQPPGKPANPS